MRRRKAGKSRLYVALASLDQGIFELGHMDLDNRVLHPSSREPWLRILVTHVATLGSWPSGTRVDRSGLAIELI
jgi:hypothetical protein